MAEPKQRRTSRSKLLASPLCFKATGDSAASTDMLCFSCLMRAIRRLPLSRDPGGTGGIFRLLTPH